jgi:hypothetical protein
VTLMSSMSVLRAALAKGGDHCEVITFQGFFASAQSLRLISIDSMFLGYNGCLARCGRR